MYSRNRTWIQLNIYKTIGILNSEIFEIKIKNFFGEFSTKIFIIFSETSHVYLSVQKPVHMLINLKQFF
jgi:hypothetical protein